MLHTDVAYNLEISMGHPDPLTGDLPDL